MNRRERAYVEYSSAVDEVDRAIVKHLQQDARQTNRELARKLGIAPSTCLERVRALRERGVIAGYRAEISLAALNRHVQALLHVQVRPLSRTVVSDLSGFLATQPEVISVFVVAGGDDLVVHVAVPSVEALHAFLVDRLGQRREVVGCRSSVVFQHEHNPVIEPL
jgi:DNA-binding Lrp family transcriptional regulator